MMTQTTAPSAQKFIPPFNHKPGKGVDLMGSAMAAELLAARIVKVWAENGHHVDAWVVKLSGLPNASGTGGTTVGFTVLTDLVNGMPSGLGRTKWERKFGRGN